jgi:ABC-type enterobactin transport system permease subunit
MRIFKEILVTLVVGALFGGGIIAASAYLHLSIPTPHQRPIFFIGIILFSIAFRLLMTRKEEDQ